MISGIHVHFRKLPGHPVVVAITNDQPETPHNVALSHEQYVDLVCQQIGGCTPAARAGLLALVSQDKHA